MGKSSSTSPFVMWNSFRVSKSICKVEYTRMGILACRGKHRYITWIINSIFIKSAHVLLIA